jgi:nucleoside-triphosphatase
LASASAADAAPASSSRSPSSSSSSPRTRIWLITGPPGIGKSTLVSKVVFAARSRGYGVGGCLTKEVRKGRERTGFRIYDLLSGNEADLASVDGLGPRVGRYRVNITNLSTMGASSLLRAAEVADLVVIDEVGPMELTSPEFRKGVKACLASGKPLLIVLHESMKDPLMTEISEQPNSKLTEVTLHNRDGVSSELPTEIALSLP